MQLPDDVLAQVVDARPGNAPAFVLLSEDHNDNQTKAENLQTTVSLIDKGLANLVCVEDFFANDVRVTVEKEVSVQYKGITLEERSKQIFEQNGALDDIIKALRTAQFSVSFARWVLFLRPQTTVVCIEDPLLKCEADQLHDDIDGEQAEEKDPKVEKLRKLLKFRHSEVNRRRESQFFDRMVKAYQAAPKASAVAVNVGGFHAAYLAKIIAQHGFEYVHTKPPSYKDEAGQ